MANIHSTLEKIARLVWAEKDLETAKNIIITHIKGTRIKDHDKKTIINTTMDQKSKPRLDQYIANSLLKYAGLGLHEVKSLKEEFKIRNLIRETIKIVKEEIEKNIDPSTIKWDTNGKDFRDDPRVNMYINSANWTDGTPMSDRDMELWEKDHPEELQDLIANHIDNIREDNYPAGAKDDPNAPWNTDYERPETKRTTSDQLEYLGDRSGQIYYFVKENDYFSFDSNSLYSEEDDVYYFADQTYDNVIDLVNDQWVDKDLTTLPTEVEAEYVEGELMRVTPETDGWDDIQDFLADKKAKEAGEEERYGGMVDRGHPDLEEMAREFGYLEKESPTYISGDLDNATIEFGGKEYKEVEFTLDSIMQDHGNKGKDALFIAEGDGIVFTVEVYLEASYEYSGNIGDVFWDTLEGDISTH